MSQLSPWSANLWHQIDLVKYVQSGNMSVESVFVLKETLEDYENRLDVPLKGFEGILWSSAGAWLDPPEDLMDARGSEVGLLVSGINRKYFRSLSDGLQGDERTRFVNGVTTAVYPTLEALDAVCSRVDSASERMLALESVAADQHDKLVAIHGLFADEAARVRGLIVSAYDQVDVELGRLTDDEWKRLLARDPAVTNPAQVALITSFENCRQLELSHRQRVNAVLDRTQQSAVFPSK